MWLSNWLFLFSTLLAYTQALPWSAADPTTSYNPADYTARPTVLLQPPRDLVKKAFYAAQTCGWISGSPYSPVVCESGSECVWDEAHLVVGCCPGGVCSTGIYTSCVDSNSPARSGPALGVLTCSGTSVCSRADYPGGYLQYGCGASNQGVFIDTTYSGMGTSTVLNVVVTSVTFATPSSTSSISSSSPTTATTEKTTETTTGLTTGTTTGTPTTTTTFSSTSSISSPTSVSSTATVTRGFSVTSSATASPEPQKKSHAGIIAGITIAVLAGLFASAALTCYCFRRRASRKQDNFIRVRHEEKIKYLGTKTSSLTSSIRGSSDHDLPYVLPDVQSRELDLEQQSTTSGVMVSPRQGNHYDIQSARPESVSPLTPPQHQGLSYSALPHPTVHLTSSFEAHPGQLWPLAPISPTIDATSTLFSQNRPKRSPELEDEPKIAAPDNKPRTSYPELRRVQLTDAPYNSPINSAPGPASITSTLSLYVRPPTPPIRSPKRLDPNRQSVSMSLARSNFHPDPIAPMQISQIEFSKDVSPRQLRTQSHTGYSALKDEESGSDSGNSARSLAMHLRQNPFSLPVGDENSGRDIEVDPVTGTDAVRPDDTYNYVNTTATTSSASKSKTRIKSPIFPAPKLLLYPPICQKTGPIILSSSSPSSPSSVSNLTISSSISNFSDTSRYSRSTSGVQRSLTGRTLTEVPSGIGSSNENGNGLHAGGSRLSLIARKPLPTGSAVAAGNGLIGPGHLGLFMREIGEGFQKGVEREVGREVAGAERIENKVRIEGLGSTKPGEASKIGLGNMSRVTSKTERAVKERWTIGPRPNSSDSAYVAPLRVASRSDNGAAAGVPLLGIPRAGERRRSRVYDV